MQNKHFKWLLFFFCSLGMPEPFQMLINQGQNQKMEKEGNVVIKTLQRDALQEKPLKSNICLLIYSLINIPEQLNFKTLRATPSISINQHTTEFPVPQGTHRGNRSRRAVWQDPMQQDSICFIWLLFPNSVRLISKSCTGSTAITGSACLTLSR